MDADQLSHFLDTFERIPEPLFSHFNEKGILSYAEKQTIESSTTNKDKLITLLNIIKSKDAGWQSLLDYLTHHDYSQLADKLRICSVSGRPKDYSLLLENISSRLANYYTSHYCNIRTMWENHQHVKDVWVELQMEDKTKSDIQNSDKIDYVSLMNRIISSGVNVGVVKGNPGAGKTTLVKKIAYDWAAKYGTADKHQFDLVLAVPLRSAQRAKSFLQLATDFVAQLLEIECREELLGLLKSLDSRLLICLDGLDEYTYFCDSPFKSLFAEPFNNPTHHTQSPPLYITFKMIITSRPYGCELTNREFFPLRFKICPLDRGRLDHFIDVYCQTHEGKKKVAKYVQDTPDLVITIPLILLFVCHLADSKREIPSNLTFLYVRLIRQILLRANADKKLAEVVDPDKWIESKVITTTMELAFRGCAMETLKFHSEIKQDCGISNDTFACGFLVNNYNFPKEALMAEFIHRSVQELFAAYYCHLQIVAKAFPDRNVVIREVYRHNSQFGRFLFGVCSTEGTFTQMLQWLNPSFADMKYIGYSFDDYINYLSNQLSDCSAADCSLCGNHLISTVTGIVETITTPRREFFLVGSDLVLRDSFAMGLGRKCIDPYFTNAWFIPSVDRIKSAVLAYNFTVSPEHVNWKKYLDTIDILLWNKTSYLDSVAFELQGLPVVTTLVLQCGLDVEVNYQLVYSRDIPEAARSLRHFSFSFFGNDIEVISPVQPTSTVVSLLSVDKVKTLRGDRFFWVRVRVDKFVNQAELVSSLTRLPHETRLFTVLPNTCDLQCHDDQANKYQ